MSPIRRSHCKALPPIIQGHGSLHDMFYSTSIDGIGGIEFMSSYSFLALLPRFDVTRPESKHYVTSSKSLEFSHADVSSRLIVLPYRARLNRMLPMGR